MTFIDRSNQPDSSQPLTFDRPWNDPRIDSPYPQPQQPQPRQLPPALYIPNTSRPPRDSSEWGGDHPPIQAAAMYPGMPSNPDMPSGLESYPTMARSAGYLSKWGSDNVSQQAGQVRNLAMSFAPLLDLLSKGGFSREFNASSLNSIKIQQQRLILEGEQLQQNHARELSDYGTIITRADAISKTAKDPAEATKAIEDAREELRFLAETKYRHPALVAALDSSGGLEAAKYLLNQEDAQFRDLWSGVTSLKKAAGVDEDVKTADEWGEPRPGTAGSGGGIFGTPKLAEAEPEEKGQRAPDTPASSDFNSTLARNMKLSPQEMRAVDQEVATGKPSPGIAALKGGKETALDHDITRKVGLGVDAKNAYIDDIIDDKNKPLDQKMRDIMSASPAVGAQLEGLRRYQLDPKEPGVPNRNQMTNRAIRLFGKDYDEGNYAAIQEFKKDRPERRLVTRAGSMGSAALGLWGALNETKEGEAIPLRAFENYVSRHFDPNETAYYKIFDGLMDFAQHFQAIETGTGTPRVTPTMEWLRHISVDSSPAQIRGAMMQNIVAAFQVINTEEGTWEKLLKRNDELMPGITPHDYRMLRDLVRADTDTGTMPSDSVREALAVSRDPKEASRPFRDNPPPLTMKQIREDYLPRIAAMENSPDPQKRRDAQAARRRVGRVIEIERLVPEVDTDNADVRR